MSSSSYLPGEQVAQPRQDTEAPSSFAQKLDLEESDRLDGQALASLPSPSPPRRTGEPAPQLISRTSPSSPLPAPTLAAAQGTRVHSWAGAQRQHTALRLQLRPCFEPDLSCRPGESRSCAGDTMSPRGAPVTAIWRARAERFLTRIRSPTTTLLGSTTSRRCARRRRPLRPAPCASAGSPSGLALPTRTPLSAAASRSGLALATSAAAPAVTAAAALVPVTAPAASSSPRTGWTATPGATTSGLVRPSNTGPLEENAATRPASGFASSTRGASCVRRSAAPTVSAAGAPPGAPTVPYPSPAGPSFPAAATTSVPSSSAPATALLSGLSENDA